MKLKEYFNEWFSFSATEKNGILILFVLIFILSGTLIFQHYRTNGTNSDFTSFEAEITRFQQEMSQAEKENERQKAFHMVDSAIYFEFDPNTVSKEDFIKLGFTKKNAETFDKYRKNKGHFYKKEDFKKLFFVSDSLYKIYEPFIVIEADIEPSESSDKKKYADFNKSTANSPAELLSIELNSADSVTLDQLKGIGPSFASRIVKYRKRLGGYASDVQLLEVYGFTPEMLAIIKPNIYVNTDAIVQINVNTATFKELIRHPYMNKDKVIRILDYLKVMKKANSLEELVKNKILDASDYEKLKLYLAFD